MDVAATIFVKETAKQKIGPYELGRCGTIKTTTTKDKCSFSYKRWSINNVMTYVQSNLSPSPTGVTCIVPVEAASWWSQRLPIKVR